MVDYDVDGLAQAILEGREKLASGHTTEIDATPTEQSSMDANTKAIAALFESKDGLAQNAKKDLERYFDTKDPRYALRKQTLIEKVAQVLRNK